MFACAKLRTSEHSFGGWRQFARSSHVLRTVVVMDRLDRILIAYTIVLNVGDYHVDEEAFIIEARRKAREEKIARDRELATLKYLLL
jgi:hypothetical protein